MEAIAATAGSGLKPLLDMLVEDLGQTNPGMTVTTQVGRSVGGSLSRSIGRSIGRSVGTILPQLRICFWAYQPCGLYDLSRLEFRFHFPMFNSIPRRTHSNLVRFREITTILPPCYKSPPR